MVRRGGALQQIEVPAAPALLSNVGQREADAAGSRSKRRRSVGDEVEEEEEEEEDDTDADAEAVAGVTGAAKVAAGARQRWRHARVIVVSHALEIGAEAATARQ